MHSIIDKFVLGLVGTCCCGLYVYVVVLVRSFLMKSVTEECECV